MALAFAVMIYSGAYSVVTSLGVLGFYVSYIIPVGLGWAKKGRWVARRGPWHLGARSNMINALACAWTLFICIVMVMPPNQRAGLGLAAVIGVLYMLHRLTGRHEMRKPVWELNSANAAKDS